MLPFPYSYELPGMTTWLISWMQLCQPYIKNAQVVVCPSWKDTSHYADGVNAAGGIQNTTPLPFESYTTVYVASLDPMAPKVNDGPGGHAMGQVTKPAECIFGWEMKGAVGNTVNNYGPDGFYCGQLLANLCLNLNSNSGNMPHNGGMNCFYCDGHAKS